MKISLEAFDNATCWVRTARHETSLDQMRSTEIALGVLTAAGMEFEQPGVTGNSLGKHKISPEKRDATLKRVVAALGPNVPPYVTETVMNHVLNALDVEVERPKTPEEKIADFAEAVRARGIEPDGRLAWRDLEGLIQTHLDVEI